MTNTVDIDREAIVQTFLAETEENLTAVEENLVRLEAHPEDEEALGTVFRAAHTLKGNAASLGFAAVAEFAHAAEDLLERLRDRALPLTGGLVTLLLQAVDALRNLVPDAVAGIEGLRPDQEALRMRLLEASADDAPVGPLVDRRGQDGPGDRRAAQASAERRTLRVDIDKLDRMLNLIGEIAIARGRLAVMLQDAAKRTWESVVEAHRESDRLSMDLQEQVMKVRMVPVGPTFRQYLRTVRDVATAHGKLARLVIEGEDVEVDMTVIEHLRDPLTHMIRNAIDHGIESPDARRTRGKNPCGSITLKASHDSGNIVIEVADDGAGLSRERILERARSGGGAIEAEKLSDQEVYQLVFEPGFSTAETVTDLSGRGVGMDVVRRNIDALRGSVGIDSREGEGARITIRLPLTLAIIEGFAVGVGDETYVVPLDAVVECIEMPIEEKEKRNSHGSGVISLHGEALPYLRLRQVFALGDIAPPREHIIVVRHLGGCAGLTVDTLLGERQTVIKPLGRLFQGLPGVSGSTILGNGRVALILDVPVLLREALRQGSTLAAMS